MANFFKHVLGIVALASVMLYLVLFTGVFFIYDPFSFWLNILLSVIDSWLVNYHQFLLSISVAILYTSVANSPVRVHRIPNKGYGKSQYHLTFSGDESSSDDENSSGAESSTGKDSSPKDTTVQDEEVAKALARQEYDKRPYVANTPYPDFVKLQGIGSSRQAFAALEKYDNAHNEPRQREDRENIHGQTESVVKRLQEEVPNLSEDKREEIKNEVLNEKLQESYDKFSDFYLRLVTEASKAGICSEDEESLGKNESEPSTPSVPEFDDSKFESTKRSRSDSSEDDLPNVKRVNVKNDDDDDDNNSGGPTPSGPSFSGPSGGSTGGSSGDGGNFSKTFFDLTMDILYGKYRNDDSYLSTIDFIIEIEVENSDMPSLFEVDL